MQTTSHFPTAPPCTSPMTPKPRDPLQCPVCHRTFSRKDNLRTHQRLHTGEKPFLCKFCAQPFRWAGALHTHENLHLRGGKAFKFIRPSRSKTPSTTTHNSRLQSTLHQHHNQQQQQQQQQQSPPASSDENPDHRDLSEQRAHVSATTSRGYTTLISQSTNPFRSPDTSARLPPMSEPNPPSKSSPYNTNPRPMSIPYALASSSPTSAYPDRAKNSVSNARTMPRPLLPPLKFDDCATSTSSHLQPAPTLPSAPSSVLRSQHLPSSSAVAPPTMPPPLERSKLPPVSHAPFPKSDLGYRLPSLSELTSPPVKRSQPLAANCPLSTTIHPVTQPQVAVAQRACSAVSMADQEPLKCRRCCRTASPNDGLRSPRYVHATETSYSCKSCAAASRWNEDTGRQDEGYVCMGRNNAPTTRQERIGEDVSANEMTIRSMEQGDGAKGLFALLQRHTTLPHINEEQFAQMVEERRKGGRVTIVAVKRGRVVGMGALLMEKMFVQGGGIVGHVMDVVVENKTGNDEVHKGIVEKLAKMGWDGGCHKIVVESDEENVNLHESCGFAAEKRRMGMCMYRER